MSETQHAFVYASKLARTQIYTHTRTHAHPARTHTHTQHAHAHTHSHKRTSTLVSEFPTDNLRLLIFGSSLLGAVLGEVPYGLTDFAAAATRVDSPVYRQKLCERMLFM